MHSEYISCESKTIYLNRGIVHSLQLMFELKVFFLSLLWCTFGVLIKH